MTLELDALSVQMCAMWLWDRLYRVTAVKNVGLGFSRMGCREDLGPRREEVRGNLRQLPNEVYCEGGRDGPDMWHGWGIKGITFF